MKAAGTQSESSKRYLKMARLFCCLLWFFEPVFIRVYSSNKPSSSALVCTMRRDISQDMKIACLSRSRSSNVLPFSSSRSSKPCKAAKHDCCCSYTSTMCPPSFALSAIAALLLVHILCSQSMKAHYWLSA